MGGERQLRANVAPYRYLLSALDCGCDTLRSCLDFPAIRNRSLISQIKLSLPQFAFCSDVFITETEMKLEHTHKNPDMMTHVHKPSS